MSIELFNDLEQKIDKVIERDQQLQRNIGELTEVVNQKDVKIQELEENLQNLESEKAQIKVKLDNIISKLDGLLLNAEGNDGTGESGDSWE